MTEPKPRKSRKGVPINRKPEQARYDMVARMVAAGMTAKQIMAETDVSEPTIYRWRTLPEFKELVNQYRMEVHERAMSAIVQLQVNAFNRVQEKLQIKLPDEGLTHRDQLTAAKLIFDVASKAIQESALMEEVKSLRREIEELKNGSGSINIDAEAVADGAEPSEE